MNKTQAIKAARKQVGELYLFGGQWKYNTLDTKIDIYRESNPSHYDGAKYSRAQTLIDKAHELMGGVEPIEYNGGRWTDYI